MTPLFAVLSLPANETDVATAKLEGPQLMAAEEPTLSIDVSGARILSDTAEGTVILLPTKSGQACFTYEEANGVVSGNCRPVADVARSGLWISGRGRSHRWWGVGVMPDGVTSVDFTLRNGGTQSVPVVNNVYRAPPGGLSARVTIDGVTTKAMEIYGPDGAG